MEAPAFRKMVTKLNPQYSAPHRTCITKRVLDVCHEVESNGGVKFGNYNGLLSDSYIMGHWLTENFEMKGEVTRDSHTSVNLRDAVQVLNTLEFPGSVLQKFTTTHETC